VTTVGRGDQDPVCKMVSRTCSDNRPRRVLMNLDTDRKGGVEENEPKKLRTVEGEN